MPLDFVQNPQESVKSARRIQGQMAHAGGASAEDQVASIYAARGAVEIARRWRGKGGEIDLIFRSGDTIICVEVKKTSGSGDAMSRLSRRQITRLYAAAEEFLGTCEAGLLTEVRFDVAGVDAQGKCKILENAFA